MLSRLWRQIKAKELAIKANVPTLEKAESIKDSKQLGFPLLIKAGRSWR